MTILDNELVRKYFGDRNNADCVSCRLIIAMQEPIKKGEQYLLIDCEWPVVIKIADSNSLDHEMHLGALRLPDRFQKQANVDAMNEGMKEVYEQMKRIFDKPTPEPECCRDKTHQGPCNKAHPNYSCPVCKPEPEKCNPEKHGTSCHCFKCVYCGDIGDSWWHSHHRPCKPKDEEPSVTQALEEKIEAIGARWYADLCQASGNPIPVWSRGPYGVTKLLSELVALARKK